MKLVDKLAVERTSMANERTFLAYARSAFTTFIAGVTFLKIFHDEPLLVFLGWFFMGIGPFIFLWGIYRAWQTQKKIVSYYPPEQLDS